MTWTEKVRWFTATVATAAVAVLLGAGAVRADVTVERTMKNAGFGGMGASTGTVVEKYSGLRKRDAGTLKFTGVLGKMTGDMVNDEITDVPRDTVWDIDHKQKTYTESRITPPKQPEAEEKSERPAKKEKPAVRVVRNEVTVKGPGERKNLNGFDCTLYTVVWVLEVEDLETKERSESTMTSDLWTTPETDATRALTKAEREFNQAWLKKIGWDMTDKETQRLGLAMVGALIGGDEESLRKGAKEVAEKLEKIKGYPIGSGVKWHLKSSGGSGGKQSGGGAEGMPDIAKGIGGLMSMLGKKGKGGESGGSGDAGGSKPIFDMYSEIRSISTASLPDSDFKPPAGYQKE